MVDIVDIADSFIDLFTHRPQEKTELNRITT